MRIVIEIIDDGRGGVTLKDRCFAREDEKYSAALDLGRWVLAAAKGMVTRVQEDQVRHNTPEGSA